MKFWKARKKYAKYLYYHCVKLLHNIYASSNSNMVYILFVLRQQHKR